MLVSTHGSGAVLFLVTVLFTSGLVDFPPTLYQSSPDGCYPRLGGIFGIRSAIESVVCFDEVSGGAFIGRCKGLIPTAEE